MGRYKAVFFDRDGTLVRGDPEWTRFRDEHLEQWSGRKFDSSYDYFMKFFEKVERGGFPFAPYKTVDQEMDFFRQWYLYVFEDMGITEKTAERADMLVEKLWYLKKHPYPETVEVLEYFRGKGYKMGVISDSTPSLEMTLEACGLHRYFTSFTASSGGGRKAGPGDFPRGPGGPGRHGGGEHLCGRLSPRGGGRPEAGIRLFSFGPAGNPSGGPLHHQQPAGAGEFCGAAGGVLRPLTSRTGQNYPG